MLAVVDEEQALSLAQRLDDDLLFRSFRLLPEPERGCDGLGHKRRIGQARQLDQPHPVDGGAGARHRLESEAGLAAASRAGQGHQPRVRQQTLQLHDLVLATHEAGERRRQRRRGRRARDKPWLRVDRGVLHQNRLLEPLQRGAGLEAELLAEMVGGPAVRPQRLALAARAVERKHELAPERLPQRVLKPRSLDRGE